jgi:hypothetical protein
MPRHTYAQDRPSVTEAVTSRNLTQASTARKVPIL